MDFIQKNFISENPAYRIVEIQMLIELIGDRILSLKCSYRGESLQCCIGVSINRRSGDAFDPFHVSRCAHVDVTESNQNDAENHRWDDEIKVYDGNENRNCQKFQDYLFYTYERRDEKKDF